MGKKMTTRKTKVYCCGRMRGLPQYGFERFDKARDRLLALGFDVVSPADIDRSTGFDPYLMPLDTDWNTVVPQLDEAEIMARDIDALDHCDAIYIITDGIEHSKGAAIEMAHAAKRGMTLLRDTMDDVELGLFSTITTQVSTLTPEPAEPRVTEDGGGRDTERGGVLDEAKRLICGDRNASYGPPSQDFQRTADMMTALFGWMLKDGCRFKARDVAWVMICVKASRSQHSSKRDNYVDAAGYAACGWECEQAEVTP